MRAWPGCKGPCRSARSNALDPSRTTNAFVRVQHGLPTPQPPESLRGLLCFYLPAAASPPCYGCGVLRPERQMPDEPTVTDANQDSIPDLRCAREAAESRARE